MLDALEKVFMIVSVGEFIAGVIGNGFIAFIYFIAWMKKQKLYLVDFILTSLAGARFTLLWVVIINFYSVVSNKDIQGIMDYNHILTSVCVLTNHLCTWFATCLTVFYLLKIANFSHPLFLWLKWRVNKVIFMLLLVSAPFVVTSLPSPYGFNILWYYTPSKYDRNKTWSLNVSKIKNLNYSIVFLTASLPPISLALVSFVLLLLSLRRHLDNLKLNNWHLQDPSAEAHFRAMKTVLIFLVLFVLYQFSLFMVFMGHHLLLSKLVIMFGYVTGLLYLSAHSYVVIFGNSQMRTVFLGILWCLKGEALVGAYK